MSTLSTRHSTAERPHAQAWATRRMYPCRMLPQHLKGTQRDQVRARPVALPICARMISTTPCAPTSNTNSTVGAGGNHQAYCTTLAGFSSEAAIGTDAANACQLGTTDGCAYNATSHTMSCPAQTAVARPLAQLGIRELMSSPQARLRVEFQQRGLWPALSSQ